MIKKYIYCLLLLVSCLSLLPTLYGCQMKEDDLFEMDAANRSDAWMADYRRVFNNNKYGWALYTDNPTYGRHPSVATYAVKFDQVYSTFYKSISTVRLPGVADKDSVVSMYSFKMDNGIVLSFDTYNGFFHYYADQSQYFAQDLQGDFEFCLDRYSENEDTILIASGGQGSGEDISKAECIRSILVDKYGIDNERIILEDRSTDTEENFKYSYEIINDPDASVGVITNGFHELRALSIAKRTGFTNTYSVPAVTLYPVGIHYVVREFFGMIEYYIKGM